MPSHGMYNHFDDNVDSASVHANEYHCRRLNFCVSLLSVLVREGGIRDHSFFTKSNALCVDDGDELLYKISKDAKCDVVSGS